MSKERGILVINPGSTSTKVAVYEGCKMLHEISLDHTTEELKGFKRVVDQFGFRKKIVLDSVVNAGIELSSIDAVMGRGGLIKPVVSGTYRMNEALARDLRDPKYGEHASDLGGLLAQDIALQIGEANGKVVEAFISDPVVVDELEDVARVTGLPELSRISIFHALNQKAVARAYAEKKGVKYESLNLIVAHMGGGVSVGAHLKGRVVDVNNALDGEGPFSPNRTGTLPVGGLVDLALSGKYTRDELHGLIVGNGGVVAHLGTNDMRIVSKRAEEGDKRAILIQDAMSYNVAKTIGAMSTVLKGEVDAIILTGGIAYGKETCDYIKDMVKHIGEVIIIPGENELDALARNALSVLEGKEQAKVYA